MRIIVAVIIGSVLIFGCTSQRTATNNKPEAVSSLRYLSEYTIPFKTTFDSTWVGGLSGIDYDAGSQQYYIVCDERSATSPSRFYTAGITIAADTIQAVNFQSVHTFKGPDGKVYSEFAKDPLHAADPESIRKVPGKDLLVWTSEGDRNYRNGVFIKNNPWVYLMDIQGNYKDSFHLASNLHMQSVEKGPRENGVFEGSAFSSDGKKLYVSLEEPLYEDGERAGLQYAGAPVRITEFDVATKKPVAQYAYLLDAIAQEPKPAGTFAVNGVSEILCIAPGKFIVMERSFSTGNVQNTIKLYLADFSKATNIIDNMGLGDHKSYKPAIKKLLYHFDNSPTPIDNIEGITFGPKLSNGHSSIIVVSDNNFSPKQKTQFILLEVLP